MTRVTWSVLALGCISVGLVGCRQNTVEIPTASIIVKHGSRDVKDIIAVFPQSTRLAATDKRLVDADVLPYWRWDFHVMRNVKEFKYSVTLSIMGSPAEALKYRDKADAGWRRQELEAWSGEMLDRFEADMGKTWTAYHTPLSKAEEEEFSRTLRSWFLHSEFANQGIHIERIFLS